MVRRSHWHMPDWFCGAFTSRAQLLSQPIAIGEHPPKFLAQRHNNCPGKRCQIHHHPRLEPGFRVMQGIRQHQPTLGISVDHLDGFTRHCRHDITRALGIAIGHIFNQANHTDNIFVYFASGNGGHSTRHSRRTAHIPLHIFHAFGRFQRDTTSIKRNPLANKCQRCLTAATAPVHDHKT